MPKYQLVVTTVAADLAYFSWSGAADGLKNDCDVVRSFQETPCPRRPTLFENLYR